MSYNGSGTFVINSTGQPVVTGTVISSSVFNALTADLGTGLSTAITKDGQTTTTARVPFAAGINSSLTTDATSTTTGSIITAGGISTQKALFVGTTANIAGAATLSSTLGVAGVTTLTNTSAGAATTPLILRNASGTASTESVLQFNPSASTARYSEIASRNDGANTTSLILRGGSGGTLTDGITVSGLGVVTLSSGSTILSDPIMTRGATETVTGAKTLTTVLTRTQSCSASTTYNALILNNTAGVDSAGFRIGMTPYTNSVQTAIDFVGNAASNFQAYISFLTDGGGGLTERVRISANGGVTIGAPTGGTQGAGTLNATGVYDDGTLLTCYVLEVAVTGSVDMAKWDKLVPNCVIPAVFKTVDDTDAEPDADGVYPTKLVEVEPEVIEERIHTDARKFVSRIGTDSDPLDIDKYAAHWKAKRHLTSMPNKDKFDIDRNMATGTWIQRLVETVEIQAVHIDQLNQRLKALEAGL